MVENFKPKEILKKIGSDEKTPRMFGLKNFNSKESSASIHSAIHEHIGDAEIKQAEPVIEKIDLEKEVVSDNEDFFPTNANKNTQSEEEIPAFDLRMTIPPDAPKEEDSIRDKKSALPEYKIGMVPGEEDIATAILKEIAKFNEPNETKGFKSGGEKIRIIIPDINNDPERLSRITDLGLKMIEMAEKRRLKDK